MLASSQIGHVLAYRLAYPDAQMRWQALLSSGHGYISYWPLLFGVAGGVLLVGLVAGAIGSVRHRGPRPLPAWVFALLPMAGFTTQEFTERWLAGSNFPWWMVLQPTFRFGLAFQLPFALVAFLLARFLVRTAERIVRALRGAAAFPQPFFETRSWSLIAIWPLRGAVLADGHAGRGPPLALLRPATC
jgi:hypothetical protein